MNAFRRAALLLLVCASSCAPSLRAAEDPVQPLLLPMAELLRQLDASREWQFVPLADYRALQLAAGRTAVTAQPIPGGAWIEQARITGDLRDDRELRLTAELTVASVAAGATRCPLFAKPPALLGAITIDGQPALYAGDAGLDLLVPGPGRHQVVISWGARLGEGDELVHRGALPLPLAAGALVRLRSSTPGSFAGPGVVEEAGAAPAWLLADPGAATAQLAWHPGRLTTGDNVVFGAEQAVQVAVASGPAALRWVARLAPRRGALPTSIEVVLPAGWTLTSPGPGVLAITGTGTVRLSLDPRAREIACDGFIAADAVVGLPRILGASYQGGTVTLSADGPLDYVPPAGWGPAPLDEAAPGALRRFALAAPDAGMRVSRHAAAGGARVATSASVAIGPTPHEGRIVQVLTIAGADRPRFTLPLAIPAGWKVSAFQAQPPATIAELAGGDDPTALAAGATLTLRLTPTPVEQDLILTVTLTGDPATTPVRLATVPGAERTSNRVVLLAAPALEVGLAAAGWRLAERPAPFPAARADQVLAELFCTGAPPELPLAVAVRPVAATAEAVCYLLPRGAGDTWARVDLRLQVQGGELTRLRLALPVADGARVHVDDALFTVSASAGALQLEARTPWRGEHLLRLECELAPAAALQLPQLALAADGASVPLRQITVVQAPADLDLNVTPGAGCSALDEDELPAWSRPIPGALLSGAWRCASGAAAGSIAILHWPLAAAPSGFIDQLAARTQVSADGRTTWVRLRLAAPGLQALDLGLPADAALVAATVDGQAVAVRSDSHEHGVRLLLPLPGRTQVGIVLLYAQPAPGTHLVQPLPLFAGLPITTCTWQVAFEDRWQVTPVNDRAALPLVGSGDGGAARPWFAPWRTPGARSDVPAPPRAQTGNDDDPDGPRRLVPATNDAPVQGEATLILAGQIFTGTRSGDGAVLEVELADLAGLRAMDRCGWALACLCGVALLAATWRRRLVVGAAALLVAVALHAWSVGAGPLLALAEGLPVALLVLPALRALLRLAIVRRTRVKTRLATLLLFGACAIHAQAAEPLLMGYDRLDAAGVPLAVRVALTRDQLTTLWQRAQGGSPASAPVCDLATGAARYALTSDGASVDGALTMPVAVPGDAWQELRIPIGAATVRVVTALPLGHAAPPDRLAARSADGALLIACPPRQQFLLRVEFAVPVARDAAATTFALATLGSRGGDVQLRLPTGWTPTCSAGTLSAPAEGEGLWSLDLPAESKDLSWRLRRSEAEAAHDLHRTLDQELRASLAPGRIEWEAALTLGVQGGSLRDARLHLPAGMVVTAVSGQALAAWRQDGDTLDLSWSVARSGGIAIRAQGLQARAATGTAAAAWAWPGAERSTGRLDFVHGLDERFRRPELPTVERADPRSGADLAVRWSDQPGDLAIAWEAVPVELRLVQQGALVAGLDRLRATLITTISGRGASDALRLHLPGPWLVSGLPSGVSATFAGSGDERVVVLRAAAPWRAGSSVALRLEAERRTVTGVFSVPDGAPGDSSMVLERQEWLFGDAGDRRLRLEDPQRSAPLAIEALAGALAAQGVTLRPGESWRSACERHAGPPPQLSLRGDSPVMQVGASHYVVIGQETARWWVRLAYRIDQGAVQELRCTLPAGARLVQLHAADLGSWRQEGAEIIATLAAPARRTTALDLSLEVPLTATTRLGALTTPAGQPLTAQTVALVEEDELGLLHLDPDGLERVEGAALAGNLPEGVDAERIQQRWRAARPDWSLGVTREAVTMGGGPDGVATLVDLLSVIAPDGELRSRATWHVLNRTRRSLLITVPDGVELWEARVAGVLVRPRAGGDGDHRGRVAGTTDLMLPVRPLRPGEAALRIELTWRQRVATTTRFQPLAPRLGELRIVQSLWRFVPPPAHTLSAHGGTLKEVPGADAAAQRVRRVIEDLQRLRGLGTLSDNGVQRLHGELEVLDLELDDYLVDLKGRGGEDAALSAAAARARGPAAAETQAVINDVNTNQSDIRRDLQRLDELVGLRQNRRRALGFGNNDQSWHKAGVVASAPTPDYLPRQDDGELPWRPAQILAGADTLGGGEPAPGHRATGAASLLGIDLIPPTDGDGLVLRGQGDGLEVELTLKPASGPWWPWALVVVAGALLVIALGVRLRR